MDQGNNEGRPALLDNVSDTQILELERQFEEQDRKVWDALTGSYGWSSDESDTVWQWFAQKPPSQGNGSNS
ncbi:MAG TPA: hypothetical protein VEX13_15850 [Chloroflexia bacterium]|nr:hypothetical protein [Chloroflexia bacterium]